MHTLDSSRRNRLGTAKLMRYSTTLVGVAIALFSAAATAAKPTAPVVVNPFKVVDANGKTVSGLLGEQYMLLTLDGAALCGLPSCVNPEPSFRVPIQLTGPGVQGALVAPGGGGVYFAVAGCAGTAYIFKTPQVGWRHAALVGAGDSRLLYVSQPGSAENIVLRSYFDGSVCTDTFVASPPQTRPLHPSYSPVLFKGLLDAQGLSEPFRIE